MKKKRGNQSGMTLVTLAIMITIFGTLALAVQVLVSQSSASGVVALERARALFLAEAGLNDSFWEIKYSEKLYGPPSEGYGTISPQTVIFETGVVASFQAAESMDIITASGVVNGVRRSVRNEVESSGSVADYSIFQWSDNDLTLENSSRVAGNVYGNGSIRVYSGANISGAEFYVPEGESAYHIGGDAIPCTEMNPAPSTPQLDLSSYQAKIAEAAILPTGNQSWGDRALAAEVLVNGNLTLGHHTDLTVSGSSALIVVNGNVTINHHSTLADNISIVASGIITLSGNSIEIGSTTGRSGNLLISTGNNIYLSQQAAINGAVITPNTCQVENHSTINGFVYAGDLFRLNGSIGINGAVWTEDFLDQSIPSGIEILGNTGYLPSPLPAGLTPPGGNGGAATKELAGRWREL
ncbi:MAG: hypothetical protein JW814_11930 [Candidatus Krumholzibacteriota bacterium]|nr:hypothetical protein [Candidatus Krumholzibacteriota bacterium]